MRKVLVVLGILALLLLASGLVAAPDNKCLPGDPGCDRHSPPPGNVTINCLPGDPGCDIQWP